MRLTNKSVYLKQPTFDELRYSKRLWEDEETMSFNAKWGGTVSFPKDKWPAFFERMCADSNDFIYYHVYNLDHVFVGEVSSRYDETYDCHVMNIKILAKYRGNHHGVDALEAYLNYLFDTIGLDRVVDDIASDNFGGIALMKRVGFREKYRTDDLIILELSKQDFLS